MRLADLFGDPGPGAISGEALLLALLQLRPIHDIDLERLLTAVRRGLLAQVAERADPILDTAVLEFFCALAQQCFINEYVFALSDIERVQLRHVRDRIVAALATDAEIPPLDLVAAASYMPLHNLPTPAALLDGAFPSPVARLLTQQISEPLEEDADRKDIPVLTPIDDGVSLKVQNQYEENPYPRWVVARPVEPTTFVDFLSDRIGATPPRGPTPAGLSMF